MSTAIRGTRVDRLERAGSRATGGASGRRPSAAGSRPDRLELVALPRHPGRATEPAGKRARGAAVERRPWRSAPRHALASSALSVRTAVGESIRARSSRPRRVSTPPPRRSGARSAPSSAPRAARRSRDLQRRRRPRGSRGSTPPAARRAGRCRSEMSTPTPSAVSARPAVGLCHPDHVRALRDVTGRRRRSQRSCSTSMPLVSSQSTSRLASGVAALALAHRDHVRRRVLVHPVVRDVERRRAARRPRASPATPRR